VKLILLYMIAVCSPLIAMEAPEQNLRNLEDDLDQKCVLSEEQPPLTSEEKEKLACIFKIHREEQALLLERLKQKIAQKEILAFKVGVSIPDLTPFANRDYILRKTVTVKLNKQKLVPCRLLVPHNKLESFMNDPIIKQSKEWNSNTIESELKWYVQRDYYDCLRNQDKLKALPY